MDFRGGARSSRAGGSAWANFSARARPAVRLRVRSELEPADGHDHLSAFPEIDCVRRLLAIGVAEVAEWRAVQVGVGADRVLVTAGHLDEETYLAALASHLGVVFEPLDRIDRDACIIEDERLIEAATTGLLPLRIGGEEVLVIAPRAVAARRLVELLVGRPHVARRFRLTSAARLQRFVERHGAAAIGRHAAEALKLGHPVFSAATRRSRWLRASMLGLATLAAGALAGPAALFTATGIALALVFLAWIALRLYGALSPPPPGRKLPRLPDDRLPIYTIIVALHREAAAVEGLVASLRQLDYPLEKLDIKFVLERDDFSTRAAIRRLALKPPFEIVFAPAFGPRTKPKALNAALPLARGAFTAVYDAEDRPEPDQLRLALDAFRDDGAALACAQARLTIDNSADGWLARLFTAEYAGLFDVFLPALAARGLPLPLGGSSNHFLTAALRRAGGWDAYNVTEDADLGMRLARFGYRTKVITSSTYEEAPARLGAWLRQRTRWFKGWMQTWLVHMREPGRLVRELGLPGFAAFQLLLGGTALAALVHPLFAVHIGVALSTGAPFGSGDGLPDLILTWLYGTTFVAGYLISGLLGGIGLHRRGLRSTAWVLLAMPIHWVLLSLAAWRALGQLVTDPYRWEKTEHGLARTSRLADRAGRGRGASALAANSIARSPWSQSSP